MKKQLPDTVFGPPISQRAPLSLMVARQLRTGIIRGDLPQGTELPSEKDLGQRLGVSRTTVREALRILQAQGLLTGGDTISTQRPRVTHEHLTHSVAIALENVFRLQQVPLQDLVDLRVQIEGAAALAAAKNVSAEGLESMHQCLVAMEEPDITIDQFRSADLSFHQHLLSASGNAAYPLVIGALRESIIAHLGEALENIPDPQVAMAQLVAEHHRLYELIGIGDGLAAQNYMESHIRDFYRRSTK